MSGLRDGRGSLERGAPRRRADQAEKSTGAGRLGAAHAEAGQFDEAVATAEETLGLLSDAKLIVYREEVRARLRLYEQRRRIGRNRRGVGIRLRNGMRDFEIYGRFREPPMARRSPDPTARSAARWT